MDYCDAEILGPFAYKETKRFAVPLPTNEVLAAG